MNYDSKDIKIKRTPYEISRDISYLCEYGEIDRIAADKGFHLEITINEIIYELEFFWKDGYLIHNDNVSHVYQSNNSSLICPLCQTSGWRLSGTFCSGITNDIENFVSFLREKSHYRIRALNDIPGKIYSITEYLDLMNIPYKKRDWSYLKKV